MSQDVQPCPDISGLGAAPCKQSRWTADCIPDLSGKRYLITGGAGGLGMATASALVDHGASCIIADIDAEAGKAAAGRLSNAQYCPLDLADLSAVEKLARHICAQDKPLDGLINIAGIIPPAQRRVTKDGFELAMGLGFMGHFALTLHLMPALRASDAARVVNISSITQAWGHVLLEDLQAERRYVPNRVYAATKLACLMFGLELHERLQAVGSTVQSMVAHPGIARTQIGQERRQQRRGLRDRAEDAAQALAMRFFGQSAEQGALPILFAATAQVAEGGGFYGPDGIGQFSGYPVNVKPSKSALDPALRGQLWQLSERLTGVAFDFATGQARRV